MSKICENKSTASVLAAQKSKSMFPVFNVRNPMPNNKCDVKHSETTKKSRNIKILNPRVGANNHG